jgi:hypothetical protein
MTAYLDETDAQILRRVLNIVLTDLQFNGIRRRKRVPKLQRSMRPRNPTIKGRVRVNQFTGADVIQW